MLIRVCLSLALFYLVAASLLGNPSNPVTVVQKWIAVASAIFLLAGLWTPVMGVVIALNELSTALFFPPARRETIWMHVFLAGIAAGVAMLGPGAWSVDARLFGRKRFDIDPNRSRKPSP